MKIKELKDGYVILGDSTHEGTVRDVERLVGKLPLIIADPPYGNVVPIGWDRTKLTDAQFSSWMIDWTREWQHAMQERAAFNVWGCIGKPGFRPFFKYLYDVEHQTTLQLANLITWKKRRAYGVQNNYLFTREECAYLCNGDAKKPRIFNVPLLDELRGYKGFNKTHPAKSEYFRRSNVWTDITEIMKGKRHPTQKKQRLHEIMIEVHTKPDEWVVDPFAGAGTTAFAARKLNRRYVVIEKDERYFDDIVKNLTGGNRAEEE